MELDWAKREFSGGVDDLAVVAVAFKFRSRPAVFEGVGVGGGGVLRVTGGKRS